MPFTEHQEEVANRFNDLAKTFDSFHGSGIELRELARNLMSLAFRDVEFEKAGGMIVPQSGTDAGREIVFKVSGTQESVEGGLDQLIEFTTAFWNSGDTGKSQISVKLASIPDELLFVVHAISSGFDRPIGYFWTLVRTENGKKAASRLEYISKYVSLSVRADKASNAIELLARSTLVTNSTTEAIARGLAADCRDNHILLAFASRLSAGYAHLERIKQLTEMEKKLEMEAPSIEAGMLAMENVHDSVNLLVDAQDSLTLIAQSIPNTSDSAYNRIRSALSLVTAAKKGIAALANKAKFTKIILVPVYLKAILEDAIRKISPSAEDIGASIRLICPTDMRMMLDGDKMCRVFINLIENAVWFLETDRKGGAKVIAIETSINDELVTVKIHDNGPGIAPHELKQVFDYLFTTKGDRGMGFGLAIARRIIHGHGGHIRAQSHWGYFTEMIVELPKSLIIQ